MTTGAFYGYYKSKEELFEALVGSPMITSLGASRMLSRSLHNCPTSSSRR